MADSPIVGGTLMGDLPVVVIGAGPIGLVAAAQLVSRGERALVLEAGTAPGASIRAWSHVRLFSPWKYLTDPVAREMLASAGWRAPDEEVLPTGAELIEQYVAPLASLPALAPSIDYDRHVVAVSRQGFDKVKSAGREAAPFEVVARSSEGRTHRYLARAVIDASGTYTAPNPLRANGLRADGERELRDRIYYGIPDADGTHRARYAGKRTLVLGSGHSAFNAVLELAELARREPGTEVVWAVRRRDVGDMFGGGSSDALPERGRLGQRLARLVESGAVSFVPGFRAERLARSARGILLEGDGAQINDPVDELVVTTGYRPDLGMLRELRLDLDSWLESPAALAPLIDPNLHSCGTVYPHGYEQLKHPDPGFFILGMKSYGRAPTFLLLTGYEQVRSVVCALTGDMDGARDVRLVLPETGVCSTDSVGPAPSAVTELAEAPVDCSCDVPAASPVPLTAKTAGAGSTRASCCG